MTTPPLAAEHHTSAPFVPDDFAKFAEAVRLIGLAAQRFLPEGLARETLPKGQTSELVAMYAVMQEAISAFRSIADDIAVSASEIRRHARPETAKPAPPAVRRDEAELIQLTADLDNMRERVAMMMQERRRAGG
jgi:small-conductance mechanosensitive channel